MSTLFSGLSSLDELTGGFKSGDLIVIGARPGIGKTSFALEVLEEAGITQKENCMMLSLEMSSSQIIRKLYALRTGKYCIWDSQENEIDDFRQNYCEKGSVWIDDTPTQNLDELLEKWRRLHAEYGLKFILIDYLQLLVSPKEIDSCLIQLKSLAQELSLTIIVLSQLDRSTEARTDKRPIVSDLHWINCPETVDQILFLYRNDYYRDIEECDYIAEFNLAKHPEGKAGIAKIPYQLTAQDFIVYGEKYRQSPEIGPFFFISNKVIADKIEFAEGRKQADKIDNSCSHEQLYDRHFKSGDYIDFPRGRVVWDTRRKIGIIYIDPCIKKYADEIAREFSLKEYIIEEDEHYHCKNCVDNTLFEE